MIYAMSDIHGFADVFQKNLEWIDLSGKNRLVLLGDYIDYGPESGRVLHLIYEMQRRYGPKKVIVLRGNHEEEFLEWLKIYGGPHAGEPDEYGLVPWNDWLLTDPDFGTFRSFLNETQWAFFRDITRTVSEDTMNIEAARLLRSVNGKLMWWLQMLKYVYETERQIFVHAGIDEEAGDFWRQATPKYVFVGKYPASKGSFNKDIIAGHIGTARIAGDPDFHGVYHDGRSHYYIDGTVYESGIIPILVYDEEKEKYFEMKERFV